MQPGIDSLAPSSSFTARRQAANNLPNFELPPPMSLGTQVQSKYQPYAGLGGTTSAAASGSIASVGNLLTPPNTLPSEGMTPCSPSLATNASSSGAQTYGGTSYWPQGASTASQYGYPVSNQWIPPRGLFSPTSLNSIMRHGTNTPAASDIVSPQTYEFNQLPPFAASTSLSGATTLPTMPGQPLSTTLMTAPTPIGSAGSNTSPVSNHDPYNRQEASPNAYYSQSSAPNATTQQSFHYPTASASTTTTQSTTRSLSGQQTRISPTINDLAPIHNTTSQSPPQFPRQYGQYPDSIMSSMQSPTSQLGLMPGSMLNGYSGHTNGMQHMYGALQQPQQGQQNQHNDRPFKCDQCAQSFNRNHDLKRHKRIHLAVKPYPCNHCDKSFSRKDALKRHILVKGCGKTRIDKQEQDNMRLEQPESTLATPGITPPLVNRVGKVEA